MRFWIVGLLIGTLCVQRSATLPALWGSTPLLAGIVAAGGVMLWIFSTRLTPRFTRHTQSVAVSAFMLLSGAFLGDAWALWRADLRLQETLAPALIDVPLALQGTIVSLPESSHSQFSDRLQFVFAPDDVALGPDSPRLPSRILISIYLKDTTALPLRAGERWAFTAKLRPPHSPQNPAGFDWEGWLFEQGIRATGTAKIADAHRLAPQWHPLGQLHALRQNLRDRMLRTLHASPYHGVIIALALGDQSNIPDAQWAVFRQTGITHLVSISGLHITLFAWLISRALTPIWRRIPRCSNWRPAPLAGLVAGALAASAYVLISGFSVPAQRTLWMLLVGVIGLLFGQQQRPFGLLLAALGIVLLIDPWASLSSGFWLSFTAVGMLIWSTAGRLRPPRKLQGWFISQWGVFVGLLPLLALLFQQSSLAAPLANAFAIPLVSLLITPIALLGMLIPDLLPLAHHLMRALMWGINALAAQPWAVWYLPAPSLPAFVFASLGALWLIAPRSTPGRAWGALLLLPLLWPASERPAPGTLQLTFLDVGQGMAVHVQTATHDLIYDTGPGSTPPNDSGTRTLAPYLLSRGITHLDGLIISHNDRDHSGGAQGLLDILPSPWLLASLPPRHPLWQRSPRALSCHAGLQWQWDGVTFLVLHPTPDPATTLPDNRQSCTLLIRNPHGSALLPGDITAADEAEILSRSPTLRADLLLAPHHGSKSSSSDAWVRQLHPAFTVFSAGYRNQFKHPRPEIVEKYRAIGSQTLETAQTGAIQITFGPGPAILHRWRTETGKRYWMTQD